MPDRQIPATLIPQDMTGVIAGLASVQAVLTIFVEEFRDHRRTTELYRRDNTIVVSSLSTALQGVGTQISDLTKRIDKMEPKVNHHATRFSEISGGMKLGRAMWAAIGGAGIVSALIGYLAAHALHF